jgi:hypothetical protein
MEQQADSASLPANAAQKNSQLSKSAKPTQNTHRLAQKSRKIPNAKGQFWAHFLELNRRLYFIL